MNPVRTCLGCRQRCDRSLLVRVIALDGEVVVDHSASLPGRGSWVHPALDCVETSIKRKAFSRALRIDGSFDAVRITSEILRFQHSSKSNTVHTSRNRLDGSPKNRLIGTVTN